MESYSDAGRINISEGTYNLVKDHFKCAYRGEIEVKNKGKLNMYFVQNTAELEDPNFSLSEKIINKTQN